MAVPVLIVDDDQAARNAIVQVAETVPEVAVVGEAEDGRQALRVLRSVRVSLVLTDISMPGMNGIEPSHRRAGEELISALSRSALARSSHGRNRNALANGPGAWEGLTVLFF